jgi:hypothetical protein
MLSYYHDNRAGAVNVKVQIWFQIGFWIWFRIRFQIWFQIRFRIRICFSAIEPFKMMRSVT